MQSLFDDENFMKTNFISAWGKSNATEDFLDNLSNFEFIKPYKLNSLVLLTKKGQRTPFGKNLPGSFKYKIEKSKPNASIYHISNIVGKEKKKMEGKVISFQKTSEISFLFSVSSSDFRNNVLLRSIYHTYPLVFQPTLKQVQLQEILNKINENLLPKRTIRIMKTTAKRWIMSENKEKKKKVGSRID